MHTQHCGKFKIVLPVLTALLIVLTVSIAVGIPNKVKQGAGHTISVSGTGEVYAKPDLALTSFSVVEEAKTVVEAMQENTEKMNAIIALMKEQGVDDKDLKTTNFSIYPRYEWRRETVEWPYPEGERVLVGYEVSQSLQVKIRDLTKIGELIEGATTAGANQVGSLQFTIDNQDALKNQAREQAIDKAKDKAKELASQLGVGLVRVTNFSEGSAAPRYYALDMAESSVGGKGGEAPQIETGENKIEVTVTITYEIN